uniref:Uncharacterized protein n=1 Tax=Brassica oleracea var. oleracea TaxID=109376 RepID=A0A0D3AQ70_BRAOL
MALHMCDMVHALRLGGYPKYHHDTLKFLKVYKHLDHTETKLHFSSNDAYLLSSRLRLLHWDTFPLTTFSRRFRPVDLVEVILHRSNLRSFWKETVVRALTDQCLFHASCGSVHLRIPYTLLNYAQGIPNLRRLDLLGSEMLEQLPDLSMAVNLKELITQGCKRLRIPQSISNLTRLTKLDVSYCDKLNSYQFTIRELTGRCRHIALYFSGKKITSVLELSNKHLMNLTKREHQQPLHDKQMFRGLGLPMSEFEDFESMKSDGATPEFHGFDSIDIIRRLKELPELVQLETVKLSGCMNLQSLFKRSHAEQDLGRWLLRELWVDNCNIQSISDQLGHFINLSYVDLSSNDFEAFPSSI